MQPPVCFSLRELAAARRTTRAFRADPVAPALLAELVETAALAPSTFNTQPWRLHVFTGAPLHRLSAAILAAHELGTEAPFSPFPQPCPEPCAQRQAEFGRLYYGAPDGLWSIAK